MSATVRFRRIAARLCSEEALARVIDPLLADMEFDCSSARGLARSVKCARWASAFIATVLTLTIASAPVTARVWLKRDDRAAASTLLLAFSAIVLLCVFYAVAQLWIVTLHLPMPLYFSTTGWIRAALYLVPQGIAGFPLAILVGGLMRQRHARSARQALIFVTAFLTICAAIIVAWGVPVANQAFREYIFGGKLAPGAFELGLPAVLRALIDDGPLTRPLTAPSLWLAFHISLAATTAPLVFALLTLSLTTVSLKNARWLGASVAVAYIFYSVVPDFPVMVETGAISPAVVAWAPHTVALALTAVVNQRSASRTGVVDVSL